MMFSRFFRDERGGPAAEMALMLPMLMALLFGGTEGGYYFWSEHRVIKAVRDGARYAGRQDVGKFTCASGTGVVQATIDTSVATSIRNLTRTGTLDGTGAPGVPGWAANSTGSELTTVSATCDTATKDGLFATQPGGLIRVTVSADVPYRSLFSNLGISTASLRLRASQQAVVMGL